MEGRCENTTRERGRLGSVWRADSCRHGRAPSLARLGEKRPAAGFTGPLTNLRSLTCDSVTAVEAIIQGCVGGSNKNRGPCKKELVEEGEEI